MARIPDDLIAEIRERTDIAAVIGEHVQLKKVGNSLKGLCPFHQEKTPSFHVLPDKRFFHCFGCQKSGDVYRFLMELSGTTFAETVRELGRRAGVDIPEREETPEERERKDERGRLMDVNALAATFYREVLLGADGAEGRAYLESRGIGDEVSERFRLGMAPAAWDALACRLEARQLPLGHAVTLGLVAPRREGRGHYDKFRNRLMCPVMLPAGEVVAFSGRTLGSDPEAPKYINSTGSPIYTKGNVLFGLHAARSAFRKKVRAVVVEGNFDVIALHQAGFDETVAPLGTALTPRQIDSLRLLAPSVVLCLDGDRAGRAAAEKDIAPLLAAGVETKVAALPEGDDPDSFVRKHGAPAFEDLLQRAQPAAEYFIYEVWGRADRSADRLADVLKEAASLLAVVADDVKRTILMGKLAAALGLQPAMVAREVARAARSEGGATRPHGPGLEPPTEEARSTVPPPPSELKILAILADHPSLIERAEREGVQSLLTDGRLRDMYSAARAGRPLVEAAPHELSELVIREVSAGSYMALTDPGRTLDEALRTLRREQLCAAADDLGRKVKDAERRGDVALARELVVRQLETRSQADALRRRP